MWSVFHFADARLASSFAAAIQDDTSWSGNYVLLEKSLLNSATFYSPSGINLGVVTFTDTAAGWTMDMEHLNKTIVDKIIYSPSHDANNGSVAFTAMCNANNSTNNTSGATNVCFTGSLSDYNVQVPQPGYRQQPGEFQGYLNLTLTANHSNILNTSTTTTNLTTGRTNYQGIGLTLPPLGYWFLENGSIILDVLWGIDANRACDGLRINLAKDLEVAGWSVFGIVWWWWRLWGQDGECIWSESSFNQ